MALNKYRYVRLVVIEFLQNVDRLLGSYTSVK